MCLNDIFGFYIFKCVSIFSFDVLPPFTVLHELAAIVLEEQTKKLLAFDSYDRLRVMFITT